MRLMLSIHVYLTDVWGAIDGLKLLLGCAGDEETQNVFYNGWTHDHYVSNLFLFSPDGKIRKMFINAPGCWHESTLGNTSGMYPALEAVFESCGGRVVADSAFSQVWSRVLKSHKNIVDRDGNIRVSQTIF
jgi:DDE superfamily endonuclease